MEVYVPPLLTSALDGGEWRASRCGRFTTGVINPRTDWMASWMGPKTCLDAVAKRRKSHHYPCRELNPGHEAPSLVTMITEILRLNFIHAYAV